MTTRAPACGRPRDDHPGSLDDHPGPAWLDRVASVEQSSQFLSAYEAGPGPPWSRVERQSCWAAGLWVRAFNAKKEHLDRGGPQLERLAGEVAERSARAGLAV